MALYRCALAMRGLAGVLPPPRRREALTLLQDAANYLGDVLGASASGGASPDEGLREAAAKALAGVGEELEVARLP